MQERIKSAKAKKIAHYDPGLIYTNLGLFGLPFTAEESEVVLIPVPWEVTVSYRTGTAKGPELLREASFQVDLYDEEIKNAWHAGIAMEPIPSYWLKKNRELRPLAKKCIAHIEKGGKPGDKKVSALYKKINSTSHELTAWVQKESARWLDAGKGVGIVGGEHSVPLGLMRELGKRHPQFSILHLDAHADLREAYEGFEHSHASIQYNASKLPGVGRQVLVSVRDYSEEEADRIAKSKGKIIAFSDRRLKREAFEGRTWKEQCEEIIASLGKQVYISFDIDALNPALCPHAGTPVPGGLEFEQACYLFDALAKSGKKIIGFDLCEVADGAWDAMVGARILYRLCLAMTQSSCVPKDNLV